MGFKLMLVAATIALVAASDKQFTSGLFGIIARDHAEENVILSPLSIEMCLGLAYLGAEGSTAAELVKGLGLESSNKTEVAETFGVFFRNLNNADASKVKLRVANRVYIGQKYEVAPQFNQLAESHFGATVKNVDFSQSQATAAEINAWVEEITEHKIKDLIQPSSLDASTTSVLVNAIYFYATWQYTFKVEDTKKMDFRLSPTRKTQVDMMYQFNSLPYGELSDLNAKAIELKYSGAGISMLIIVPNEVDGLAALEEKLQSENLMEISAQLQNEDVGVRLPKFRVEFEVSLQPTLEKMGIREIFTDAADFSSLLTTNQSLAVSDVIHKAFIEVNEEGTEAAAATAIINQLSMDIGYKLFFANSPFVFAIKDNDHVYFMGHITNPNSGIDLE